MCRLSVKSGLRSYSNVVHTPRRERYGQRLARCCVWLAALLSLATSSAPATEVISAPYRLAEDFPPGSTFGRLILRGEVVLRSSPAVTVAQLSGLAWDADEAILYALSDDGYLLHLVPVLVNNTLTAVAVKDSFALRGAVGRKLSGYEADSEGLAARNTRNGIRGDSELMVSFEVRPRIQRFTPHGEFIGYVAIPHLLVEPKNYAGANLQLEAITETPAHGVIVAPEKPLPAQPGHNARLYDLRRQHWEYPLRDRDYAAITGLETMVDGSLMVLERHFKSVLLPRRTVLTRVQLDVPPGEMLTVTELARFDSADGWRIDNFEGIARHEGQRYFMISDNNNHFLQRTLLSYFEVLPALNAPAGAASTQPGCTAACGNPADAK